MSGPITAKALSASVTVIAANGPTPAFLSITGGSFGAQIGAEQIDLVLVVLNRDGVEKLLKNEFKIGGDASVAAGPVGRGTEASTDIQLTAEILSYSRARGLFAGVSLEGSSIREDEDANQRYYGRPLHNRDIVLRQHGRWDGWIHETRRDTWFQVLNRYSK